MAFNPLQQQMQKQGQIPASHGISTSEAQTQIAALLDSDGRTVDDAGVEGTVRGKEGAPDADAPGADDLEINKKLPPKQDDNTDLDEDENSDTDVDNKDDAGDDAVDGHDEQADNDAPDGDDTPIKTLTEFAEATGVPLEDVLTGLSHTFKANGEDKSATLAELVAGYRLQADYDRDKGALADQRRTFESEQQTRLDGYTQQAHILASQLNTFEQALQARLQDPALAALRGPEPGEWAAQVQIIQSQILDMQNARQIAAQQYETFVNTERAAFTQGEAAKLANDVEDWGQTKLNTAVEAIKTLGYDTQEIASIADSRLIKGALELSTLRVTNETLKKENEVLKARIKKGEKAASTLKRTLPKGITPNKIKGVSTKGVKRSNIVKLNKRLSTTHHEKDAAAVIEAMME